MPLIFKGQSTCPLCGQPLLDEQSIIGLPAIADVTNELYQFFDCGYHESCYTNWDKKEEVEKLIKSNQEQFLYTEYFHEMLKLHGPPKYLEDQFVQVIDSFQFSDDRIIVFIKWKLGKLPNGIVLDNLKGKTWAVKRYIWVTGSFETYEKTKEEEKNNIFQYLLEAINTNEKPSVNTFLKIKDSA